MIILYHPPQARCWARDNSKLGSEKFKQRTGEALGEDVCYLKMRSNKFRDEFAGLHKFTNKMKIDINVLRAFVSHRILTKKDSAMVVTIEPWMCWKRRMKLMKERGEPEDIRGGVCKGAIFRFTTRTSDGWLLFSTPRNQISSKKDRISVCRTTSFLIESKFLVRCGTTNTSSK